MNPNFSLPQLQSFIGAGFECTYALVHTGQKLDLLASTEHDRYCREDYRMIQEFGIKAVREGLAWSLIDKGNNEYDFTRFEQMMKIGKEENIQQIWDLNHFDYPAYLDPFSTQFVTQFAEYAKRAIQILRIYNSGTIYITPLNEISFSAWNGGDVGWWAPFEKGKGGQLKNQLVKAAIAAMDAIWSEDDNVRFIQVDPILRRIAKQPATSKTKKLEKAFKEIVYQSWDMLAGKVAPELGGAPKYLDIIGINYYWVNQEWIVAGNQLNQSSYQTMEWDSPSRISFADLAQNIYDRYQRPMIVSETGSFGDLREKWWPLILHQIDEAMNKGLPICGVFSYPSLDKPSHVPWLEQKSGLWDFPENDESCRRIPHLPSLKVIQEFTRNH
jgi:beta-glucosidase/6-phospho-beta-glucosidase/beta-galactosidase